MPTPIIYIASYSLHYLRNLPGPRTHTPFQLCDCFLLPPFPPAQGAACTKERCSAPQGLARPSGAGERGAAAGRARLRLSCSALAAGLSEARRENILTSSVQNLS